MAVSDFSWFKIASFFGVLILVVLAFILVANGIYQIIGGQAPYGVASILGSVVSVVMACAVYKNYQNKG